MRFFNYGVYIEKGLALRYPIHVFIVIRKKYVLLASTTFEDDEDDDDEDDDENVDDANERVVC